VLETVRSAGYRSLEKARDTVVPWTTTDQEYLICRLTTSVCRVWRRANLINRVPMGVFWNKPTTARKPWVKTLVYEININHLKPAGKNMSHLLNNQCLHFCLRLEWSAPTELISLTTLTSSSL
jgi:hypothetical protein